MLRSHVKTALINATIERKAMRLAATPATKPMASDAPREAASKMLLYGEVISILSTSANVVFDTEVSG